MIKRHSGMFKPGKSGNPNGRPKSVKIFRDLTETILAEPFEDAIGLYPQYKGISKGEVILRQLVNKAAYGDHTATKELLDRLLGKPKQQMVESKLLNINYIDFLDMLTKKE